MNPRIRELAEEAGFGIAGNPEYVHAMDYDGMCTDELEKFAELIIAECCVALRPMLRDMISRSRGVDLIVEHFRGES